MAKFHGIVKGDLKGNAGQFSFRQVKGVTVASGRIYNNSSAGEGATLAQREHRCKLANIVNFYRTIIEFEKRAWEGKPERVSDYNMFVKANLTNNDVYMPKNYANVGAVVPARYVVAKGSLTPVQINPFFGAGIDGVQFALVVGELPVGTPVTVGMVSQGIIENNAGYNNGDKITFAFMFKRYTTIGGVSYPFVDVDYIEMQLDTTSTELAAAVYQSRNMSFYIADNVVRFHGTCDAVFAVHTRMLGSVLQASNQVVVLPATESSNPYGTEEWIEACCDSYGYKGDVLIQPSMNEGGTVIYTTITVESSGHGDVAGGGSYIAGRPVTVTATPASGYAFKGWYNNAAGDGVPLSTDLEYTFNAPAEDMTIYAIFAEIIQITIGKVTNGSVTANGEVITGTSETTINVAKGTLVTLQATAASGYQFSKWQNGRSENLSTSNPYSFVANENITGSAQILAVFVAGGAGE